MGGTGLELGTADYADALARDPERRMRLTKFTVEADQRCTAIFLDHASAIVDAVATDGRRLHKEVLTNRGSMQCHLTPEDVVTRLTTNAGRALPAFVVGDLQERTTSLADAPDLAEVGRALRAARSAS
ncbi:MAG: hypothetical protein QOJ78_243 [Pseudonocardiales bacterium]|jgi:hypothetical protein|nr:hypothetical protein [Pseudonocardiales bacterium]